MTNTKSFSICVIVSNEKEFLFTNQGEIFLRDKRTRCIAEEGKLFLLSKVLDSASLHMNIVRMGSFLISGNYQVPIKWAELSLLKSNILKGLSDLKLEESNIPHYYEQTSGTHN